MTLNATGKYCQRLYHGRLATQHNAALRQEGVTVNAVLSLLQQHDGLETTSDIRYLNFPTHTPPHTNMFVDIAL